ncbi:MAG: DUF1206 domain-containing protein [Pseudonocardiales bacterium]|nr:DUF1206 domain-containing protein [Pseudonocardiales bacterium]
MPSAANSAHDAAGSAHDAASSAHDAADSRPVEIGVRIGLLCYGVTHLLIAWIALQVAFGGDNQKASQNGAFQELAANTFGKVLLWIIVVGFVAIALWRLGLAIWGYRYESDDKARLRKRASAAGKVVVFGALAVLAGSTAAGGGGGGGGQQKATAGLLGIPGGRWIVGAIGLGIIVAGGSKIYAGWKKKFVSDMSLPSDQKARDVVERTGQVGFIAKGISVALIGILVVFAAIQFDPAKASGLDAALRGLAQQPFGPWLLALVALGLAAYGVFCGFDARYHRV